MNKKFKPLGAHLHLRAESIVVKNNNSKPFSSSIAYHQPQAVTGLYLFPLGYRQLILPSEVLDEQEI